MKIKYLIPLATFFSSFLLSSSFAQDGAGADRYRLSFRDDPATTIVIGWDQVDGDDAREDDRAAESYDEEHA